MGKPRRRVARQLAQHDTLWRWWSWGLNPGSLCSCPLCHQISNAILDNLPRTVTWGRGWHSLCRLPELQASWDHLLQAWGSCLLLGPPPPSYILCPLARAQISLPCFPLQIPWAVEDDIQYSLAPYCPWTKVQTLHSDPEDQSQQLLHSSLSLVAPAWPCSHWVIGPPTTPLPYPPISNLSIIVDSYEGLLPLHSVCPGKAGAALYGSVLTLTPGP